MGSPRRQDGSLTTSQQSQLVCLLRVAARDRDSAASIYKLAGYGLANALVIGALRDLGLAESQVVRPRGGSGQHTAYWLTAAGAARAEQLRAAGVRP